MKSHLEKLVFMERSGVLIVLMVVAIADTNGRIEAKKEETAFSD